MVALVAAAWLGPGCEQSDPKTASGDQASTGTGADGKHLGKAFTVKTKVDLEQLVASPKKFEGKNVRVAGLVTAHCHHRRAWFALRTKADSPKVLRVQTRPKFLVPKEIAHGKTRAEAEGTVEVRTVPEKHAKHMAREHGLFGGSPDKITGPQHIVTLNATGASFH
jgi:hypothetical protein